MPAGLLFVAYIFLEIFVLVQATEVIGGWNVLLLVALGFVLGAAILRINQNRILSGRAPRALSLVFSSIAGVLFMVPGFVSDFIAVVLLIPAFQARMGKASDKFFMNQGFNRIFRFGYFGNMNFPGQGGPGAGPGAGSGEPEFREDIKVTVIDRDGATSTERATRRKRLDDSNIIDVEIEPKDK